MAYSSRTRCAAMSPEASARANRDDALADASGYIRDVNNSGSSHASHQFPLFPAKAHRLPFRLITLNAILRVDRRRLPEFLQDRGDLTLVVALLKLIADRVLDFIERGVPSFLTL